MVSSGTYDTTSLPGTTLPRTGASRPTIVSIRPAQTRRSSNTLPGSTSAIPSIDQPSGSNAVTSPAVPTGRRTTNATFSSDHIDGERGRSKESRSRDTTGGATTNTNGRETSHRVSSTSPLKGKRLQKRVRERKRVRRNKLSKDPPRPSNGKRLQRRSKGRPSHHFRRHLKDNIKAAGRELVRIGEDIAQLIYDMLRIPVTSANEVLEYVSAVSRYECERLKKTWRFFEA